MRDTVRQSDLERFWSKVDQTPTAAGCLNWRGATAKGYGVIRWRNDRMTQATRVAWELFYETAPDPALDLLHSCDNRPCVNVLHLREGTPTENVTDMHDRNPHCRADGAHNRRLTFAEVDEIRRRYRTGQWSSYVLGQEFGVAQTVALDAAVGRSYRRGPTEPPAPPLTRVTKTTTTKDR